MTDIPVNRLNKTAAFRDLKMLSFDLRTAIFIYSPGYIASITYSPNSDTYEVSFPRSAHAQASVTGQTPAVATPGPGMTPQAGLTPAGFTPGTGLTPGPGQTPAALTPGITPGTASTPGMHAGPSPHEPMAGLLSWWLNQLVLDHMGTRGLISQLFFAVRLAVVDAAHLVADSSSSYATRSHCSTRLRPSAPSPRPTFPRSSYVLSTTTD